MVCVKNQSTLLKRILRQIVSYVPYKNLIVIYGKSTDGTKEVAESFTENVFWDGDKGLGAARNLGDTKIILRANGNDRRRCYPNKILVSTAN